MAFWAGFACGIAVGLTLVVFVYVRVTESVMKQCERLADRVQSTGLDQYKAIQEVKPRSRPRTRTMTDPSGLVRMTEIVKD